MNRPATQHRMQQNHTLLSSVREEQRRYSTQSQDTLVEWSDSGSTLAEQPGMSTPGTAAKVERRKSYGIGGAGNIRMSSFRAA